MRMHPGIEPTSSETITFLSISPMGDDHTSVRAIVGHSRWALLTADDLFTARALLLQRHDVSVILCEDDLKPGSWTDILKHTQSMPHPPSLIVTSRLADDRLWSEVLNQGGWDVLVKPFDRSEVLRSVKSAWEHWHRPMEIAAKPTKVMRAAS